MAVHDLIHESDGTDAASHIIQAIQLLRQERDTALDAGHHVAARSRAMQLTHLEEALGVRKLFMIEEERRRVVDEETEDEGRSLHAIDEEQGRATTRGAGSA